MATSGPALPALPEPCVVVLAGAAGAGKSFWAAERFTRTEIVSSDALRAVVGSGPADLDATADAFAVLDLVITARLRRRLTTVIDTLGLEPDRRRGYLEWARRAGLPAVLVIVDTAERLCRSRNADRDRPVPAPALAAQLRKVRALATEADAEGWDRVMLVGTDAAGPVTVADAGARPAEAPTDRPHAGPRPVGRLGVEVILQLSRFAWGKAEPASWLRDIAVTAGDLGFAGIALMDHLIQIPQVDRAWEPIVEPWVSLGFLAALDTPLRLGTLVSPVTFRAPGIIAKTAATLDVLSGGRAFCGLGAGWWDCEHRAYGLDFPPARERLDRLEATIETCRALWASGTKAYEGARIRLPETTAYPRPVAELPILVGGGGERRTLKIAATFADGCNIAVTEALPHKIEVFRRYCTEAGRAPAVTVLDLPVIGTDRADTGRRVERLRGRLTAAAYTARHPAGTADDHVRRYAELAESGVSTVFLALSDLRSAADLERCAPLLR